MQGSSKYHVMPPTTPRKVREPCEGLEIPPPFLQGPRLDMPRTRGIIEMIVKALMETSRHMHTPKRVREGESRMAKSVPKITPELPAERVPGRNWHCK